MTLYADDVDPTVLDALDVLDALNALEAEDFHVPERLVTAPRAGTFVPAVPPHGVAHGRRVAVGQTVGVIVSMGEEHAVPSPFAGVFMGHLVLAGERVRPGQAVAWLTLDTPD